MTHNDVARRSAPRMPARSLTPRALPRDTVSEPGDAFRALNRDLPPRSLERSSEGGR
ncbi:hypothetical protein [Kitasatospora camelliae]|uniref:FXSXX-COOH protein n=1 Tax=Kitasatospora camelliae TaxID=3156397 RepID=A0AAU8JYV2_9ACTN